jgi:uncharacterized protein
MKTLTRRFFVPVLAATLMLGTAGAHAAVGGIQDDGGFFSAYAKANATGTIHEVANRLHKDILVQTYAEVPQAMKDNVLQPGKSASSQAFAQWAEQIARTQQVNGVLILLVKQPARLQVVVGSETARQAFTLTDRERLVQIMLEKLRARKNDEALTDGVNFIASTMTSHRGGAPIPASPRTEVAQPGAPSWLPTIGILLLIVLGFNLIRGLFRAMSGGGAPAGGIGQPYGYGGGGGGFFQNVLSSMFGAAAGVWMYDQFFGAHSSAATTDPQSMDPRIQDDGFAGTDTDYTSSGGDFGGDSGGSFGGDSGGDFGGGGGDFGGGGGDF